MINEEDENYDAVRADYKKIHEEYQAKERKRKADLWYKVVSCKEFDLTKDVESLRDVMGLIRIALATNESKIESMQRCLEYYRLRLEFMERMKFSPDEEKE